MSAGERLSSIRTMLASTRARRVVVVLGVLLVLPSLGNGLSADDHWHKISLTQDPAWASLVKPWWRLFTFYDGNPERTRAITDLGLTPWWTDPSIVIAFFRPVTSATHVLDYALWRMHPALMHAQSVAWYGALVAIAAWLYRRLLPASSTAQRPAWAAGLAGLFYALDHNHGIPVGWLANRNAVVLAVFALGSLGAHDLAVRGTARGRLWTLASTLLLALALGSGEGALGIVGFFAAHALVLDARPWARRVASLAPQAAVLAGWAAIYRLGNYGVHGSGMYFEPLREPATFAAAVVKHVPMLLACELGGAPPDLYTFMPLAMKVTFVIVAIVFVAWSAAAMMRVLRIDPVARFFALGALLALVPSCSTFPAGRLLMVPGFGLVGLVALIAAGVLDGASWVPTSGWSGRLVRSFGRWTFWMHLVVAPLLLQLGIVQITMLDRIIGRVAADLPTAPVPGRERVIFINAPDTIVAPYLFLGRSAGGDTAPSRLPCPLLTMAGGARPVGVRRTDEHTVVVRVEGGFYRVGTELLARNDTTPLPAGTKVSLTGVTVEVLVASADGVPEQVSFRFDQPADSDAYLWTAWDGAKLHAVKPPAIGEEIVLPGHVPDFL